MARCLEPRRNSYSPRCRSGAWGPVGCGDVALEDPAEVSADNLVHSGADAEHTSGFVDVARVNEELHGAIGEQANGLGWLLVERLRLLACDQLAYGSCGDLLAVVVYAYLLAGQQQDSVGGRLESEVTLKGEGAVMRRNTYASDVPKQALPPSSYGG